MSKHRNIQQLQQLHRLNRPGEGAPITSSRQQIAKPDGTTAAVFTLNLGSAPVPERRYVADVASIKSDDNRLSLIFGQTKLGDGLRSLLVVEMAVSSVAPFLTVIQQLKTALTAYFERFRVPRAELIDVKEEPSQTVALAANVTAMGFSSRDACLDFYYASPFAIQQAAAGATFVADPVVRVSLPTSLLFAMCEKLASMKDSFPDEQMEATK